MHLESGRNNFSDFPDYQLTKFCALQLLSGLLHTGVAVGQKDVAV